MTGSFIAVIVLVTFSAQAIVQHGGGLPRQRTFGASDQVQVEAIVSSLQLVLTTRPRDRVPATGNWGHNYDLSFKNCNTGDNITTISNVIANTSGTAVIPLSPTPPIYGLNRLDARGESHLNRNLGCVAFDNVAVVHNLIAESQELIPGETSVVYDNTINSLDIATVISNLNTSTIIQDLNRDGSVNLIDIDIMLKNLYAVGD